MGKAYSQDLRDRVINAVVKDEGLSCRAVAKQFGIGVVSDLVADTSWQVVQFSENRSVYFLINFILLTLEYSLLFPNLNFQVDVSFPVLNW